jgi:23S rRNA pseudouridine2605 synthase
MATEKKPARNDVREGERIAKVIARSGYCSRRAAEQLVAEGRVTLNGKVLSTPAVNVQEKDKITIDGQPLTRKEATRMWLYYKPAGLVVSESDPEGRPTVFEKFEEAGLPRVVTVGRLDINTEGLLLLTNDGGLKRVLELPTTGWTRRYRVRAHGRITQEKLDELKDGITVDKVHYGPIEATLERQQGANAWILVALKEGKNREVKNVLAALGLDVNRLIRLSYGPFQLNQMKLGEIEAVKMRVLKDQLSQKLIDEAGLDFEAPVNPVELKKPEKVDRYGRGKPRGRVERPERARRPERVEEAPKKPEGPKSRVFFEDGRTEYIDRPEREEDRFDRSDRGGKFKGKRDFDRRDGDRRDRKPRDGDKPRGDFKRDKPRDGDRDRNRGGDFKRGGGFKDKPRGEGRSDRRDGERGEGRKSFGDKRRGFEGKKPFNRDDRGGDRSRDDRGRGDKPRGDRPFGDKPRGDRPYRDNKDGRRNDRNDRNDRDNRGGRDDRKGARGDKNKTFVSAKRDKDFGAKRDGRGSRPNDRGRPGGGKPKFSGNKRKGD